MLAAQNSKISVPLKQLCGFIIGPETITFKRVFSERLEIADDADDYLCVSLSNEQGITFDFRFTSRNDAIDFIVAVS